MLTSHNIPSSSNQHSTPMNRWLQTQQSNPLKCPRCHSRNTKFCYYNNYNKTQPRHYCKACKRHWTKGGILRDVPVGGGRRLQRSNYTTTTTTTTSASTAITVDHSLGLSDHKYMFQDDKGLSFKSNGSEFNNAKFINMQQLPHQDLGLSIHSNLSFIDTNPIPIIPNSFTSLLSGFKDHSTINTTRMVMENSSTASQPWMQVPTTSNFLEPNYWSWINAIDSIVQADLNIPFDDSQNEELNGGEIETKINQS